MLSPPLLNRMARFCWRSVRPTPDQPGMWEFAGGKVEPGESQPQALVRELQEEMGIIARPACYIASHQREVSGRRIHLHAWWVPHFQGTPLAHYHTQLRWCLPQKRWPSISPRADIPLLHAFIAQRPTLSVR
ncbi:pyrimidine (deoxy)nucleoside triphosphate pyrophosphohydrolase [Klebsiella pneumoniae]|uniref:Pyrimidine (Deoxy)nucleoside triphosphate pyrophosphohydrolase n=1 Tax=Klebsiella pneumoniae TaxID=573 RepID=A0A2X3F0K8_KLEPN|nr:pyrimidine (deoxy)nucleoside triphosphate pyrophosphohydrolase [Klebsiella pneumoniae]